MASIQDLESALLQAHQAGDSKSAAILADEIRNMRALQGTSLGSSYQPRTSIEPENPSPMARIGRGFMDFAVAGARYGLPKEQAEQLTKEQDKEIAIYEAGRGKDAGFDVGRFVGNTLPTLPVAGGMALGVERALGKKAAEIIPRVLLGAGQGAVQGATTYTPEGQSQAVPIVLGAGSGAVAPLLSDAVGYVVSKAAQFGKEAAARFAAKPEAIVAELEPILAKQGVKWGDLADEVKRGMITQARRQLTVSGDLAPDAIARKLEMDDLLGPGAGPTQGQVTRDPRQWSWERNTQKVNEIGDPLTERFQAQLNRLRQVADETLAKTGGRARNDFQAGASATGAVQRKMAESKKVVDDLYDVWRETGAGSTEVAPQRLADELLRVQDEIGIENVPPTVRARLESFGLAGGTQKKLLTIDEAEKLRKLIGTNDPGRANPPASLASQRLKRALDEAVMDTESPDIPSLKAARAAARARFEMRDSGAGVTAAAQEEAPDRFFKRYILGGNIEDLRGLKTTLNTSVLGDTPPPGMLDYEPAGAQAWKDLKGRALEYAVEKATSEKNGFSGPMFRKALKELGEERLKVLFEPDELAQIMKLDRVAHGLTAEPALAAVNHSNTAAAGAQYLQSAARAIPRLAEAATGIPFVGKMAAGAWSAGDDVARNAEMRRRVGAALMGDAFDPTLAEDKRRALAKLLTNRMDPYLMAGASGYGAYKSR